MIFVTRPGLGWEHVGGAVWDHATGVRIHTSGMCRLPSGEYVVGTEWPTIQRLGRMVRINGGNRRRGVMAWALNEMLNKGIEGDQANDRNH